MSTHAHSFHHLADEVSARSAGHATLVAVSKRQTVAKIQEVYAAGARDFGENYVQEWRGKKDLLALACPDICWHFIGQLQGNKLTPLVGEVTLIHSLASLTHLKKLDALAAQRGIIQKTLVELNLSDETNKEGIAADELPSFLRAAGAYPHVRIRGLMTFPPPTSNPESSRPYFRKLRELRDDANARGVYSLGALTELSMGTSGDWRVAIDEGATFVRIGTELFGERNS